jgi:TolA-binding protein
MPPVFVGRYRHARWLAPLAPLAAGVLLLSGCGSSAHTTAHTKAQTSAAVQNTCQQVSAALSDGPDPDADPVGYAEAQIQPLHQIRTQDKSLQSAVDSLSSAYQQFYSTNGASAAKQAVSQASHTVNTICPGAAS